MLGWDWDRDLQRINPWRELERFRRRFGRLLNLLPEEHAAAFPPVNIWANDEKAVVTAEVPGVNPGKLEITVKDKTLSLKGSREPVEPGKNERYIRQERGYGSFTRIIQLPFRVDPEKVEAHYVDGILTIQAPRVEAEKPRQITVKTE